MSDRGWLTLLCLSRVGAAFPFTAWAAVLPLVREDWGLSGSQAGLVQSGWHAGYLVSLFAVGFLSDRYGPRLAYLAGTVGGAASAALFAWGAHGFVSALALYALAGLCSGGTYTPGLALVAARFDPARRGRAMGLFLAASSLGYASMLALGGLAMQQFGWRAALSIAPVAAAVSVLFAAVALRGTRDRPPAGHAPHPVHALGEVIRNRPAMLAIWSYAFHCWELLAMWAWLPAFLAVAFAATGEVSATAVGAGAMMAALAHLVSVVGSIAGGSLSDRLGRTAVMLIMSAVSLACSFGFGWMLGAPLALLVLVALVYSVSAIADSSVYSTALTELVPARVVGAAYSLRSVVGFGMGVVSPWVFGLVLDAVGGADRTHLLAWGLAWTSVGLGALLGPFAALRLRALPESRRMANGRR